MATIEEIKKLRDLTGSGINAVREALEATKGDTEEAIKYLRKKGLAKADKRKENQASNGLIGTYIHTNNSLVVLVEVLCETDFAANSPDMLKFANDIALHIAAMNPEYIDVSSIDEKVVNTEKEIFEKELEGKPEEVKAKILDGKLAKFYGERVLLKQNLFSDETKLVEDYLNEIVAKIGEKIVINSFIKKQISAPDVVCPLNNNVE